MKSLPHMLSHLTGRKGRRDLRVLGQLLLVFLALVAVFSVLFHIVMQWEGQDIVGLRACTGRWL
jgi:hypothetical protein